MEEIYYVIYFCGDNLAIGQGVKEDMEKWISLTGRVLIVWKGHHSALMELFKEYNNAQK